MDKEDVKDELDEFLDEALNEETKTRQPTIEELLDDLLNSDLIEQGVIILALKDRNVIRSKGHFYDSAAMLNSVLNDFKEKIYLDVFSETRSKS